MRTWMLTVAILGALVGVISLAVSFSTHSALHEIEALLSFLIGTIAFVGRALLAAIERLTHVVDHGNDVAETAARLAAMRDEIPPAS